MSDSGGGVGGGGGERSSLWKVTPELTLEGKDEPDALEDTGESLNLPQEQLVQNLQVSP